MVDLVRIAVNSWCAPSGCEDQGVQLPPCGRGSGWQIHLPPMRKVGSKEPKGFRRQARSGAPYVRSAAPQFVIHLGGQFHPCAVHRPDPSEGCDPREKSLAIRYCCASCGRATVAPCCQGVSLADRLWSCSAVHLPSQTGTFSAERDSPSQPRCRSQSANGPTGRRPSCARVALRRRVHLDCPPGPVFPPGTDGACQGVSSV